MSLPSGCSGSARLDRWAVPVDAPGLPNCWRLDENLLRGAQPTRIGFSSLSEMGVKTVVNVRKWHSDDDLIDGVDMEFRHVPMNPWIIREDEVVRFLKTVTDEEQTPVFVHCTFGTHRASVLCAIYRIVVRGWTRREAIDEMTRGEFGYWPLWTEMHYIRTFDIEGVRKRIGLAKPDRTHIATRPSTRPHDPSSSKSQ